MAESGKSVSGPVRRFDFDTAEIGEELGSYEYTMTEEQFKHFRDSVSFSDALFPTVAVKHDATAMRMKYPVDGGVNARQMMEYFNSPKPGMKIKVTAKLIEKYIRRDKPYIAIQATATDEKGNLIERTTTYQMRKTEEVGKKWGEQ